MGEEDFEAAVGFEPLPFWTQNFINRKDVSAKVEVSYQDLIILVGSAQAKAVIQF